MNFLHQFKLKKAIDGQAYILAVGRRGIPITAAVCPDWEWARRVARGLALFEALEAERARKRAAAQRRRKVASATPASSTGADE